MKLKLVFLLFFLAFVRDDINAKTTCDAKKSGTNFLRVSGRRHEGRRASDKSRLYLNNVSLFVKEDSGSGKNLKWGYINFSDKHYANKCMLKNGYKGIHLIKFKCFSKLWAKKKGVGSTKNGRDSNPKYLGVKILGNNFAYPGNIIVRQRGRTFKAGHGVIQGRDFTLVATKAGKVQFFKGVVSIVDVTEPKRLTFRDIYQENPTILSLSKMWVTA